MNTQNVSDTEEHHTIVDTAHQLLPKLAENAVGCDENDSFVTDNYELIKESGLIEAAVPSALGGQGANITELCDMLRILAQACGSTALMFSMHTHQVAIPAWRWKYQKISAVEPLLKKVANERIRLLSSGGSDWIGGSGKATRVEGGFRINARKIFTSGAEMGDILMTGAITEDKDGSQSVIHFGVPMSAPEVSVENTWKVLGMRGTGSNDVIIDDLFIPEENIAFSRKAGQWHPVFQIIATIAFPLIYAVYVGVAESARNQALKILQKQENLSQYKIMLAGKMDTQLRATQISHQSMIAAANANSPSALSVNEVMIGRTLVAGHGIKTVELAMELVGGPGFYRNTGLERKFRDIQAARYHPLQEGVQACYAGALALGQSVDEIF